MGALTVVGLALVLSVFIVRSEEGTGTCGERKLVGAGLIAHGSTPRAGAWPWHGAMYHRYNPDWIKYMCGVTILTEQFVLTAAHCTYDRWQRLPADRVFIKVGISNLNSPEEFNVDKIIRHEEYDKHTFENDIALLMLSFEITYTSYIQPICLWQNDTELSKIISKTGYVVGWGLDETYSFPKKLSEATMPIVSSTECRKRNTWHYYKFYFESKTFCAGRPNDTHVSAGDSGGGFYMRMGSNWVLRGIVSSAKINAITLNIQADSYTIFTDVAYYLNWIKTRVPDIPYFAVDTEQTTETAFNGDVHLLDLENCGKYTYKPGTHEEGYELVNLYPWEAVIKVHDSSENAELLAECLGLLIHPNYVISQAICFSHYQVVGRIFAWFSVLGGNDNSSMRIRIYATFIHPDFSKSARTNNIAIAKLERPATMNPICLPLSDLLELPEASHIHMFGVHRDDDTRYFRNETQLIDWEACKKKYDRLLYSRVNVSEGHVCSSIGDGFFFNYLAQWQPVKKDFVEGQYFLAALAIYGPGYDSVEYPTVFTNVAYYSKWIRNMIEVDLVLNF